MSSEELGYLREILRAENFRGTHLEIGTAAGGTLCYMINCYSPGVRPRFVVVDTMCYFRGQREAIAENLHRHNIDPKSVDFRVSISAAAEREAERRGERFDFILIDASHVLRHILRDFRWTRLLTVGGIVCLHDYKPKYASVMLAADHFLKRNTNYRRESLVGGLLVLRKTQTSARLEISALDRLWGEIVSPLLHLRRTIKKRWDKLKSALSHRK